MAEQIIASHKWRRRTRDWSAVCDNSLKLDRTYSLQGNPSKKNSFGVCAPACEMCITPYPKNIENQPCYCDIIPLFYDVEFPAPLSGTHGWSDCVNLNGASCRFVGSGGGGPSLICNWNGPISNKKIAHVVTGPFVPNVGYSYGCRDYVNFVGPIATLSVLRKPNSATLGEMRFGTTVHWGYSDGSNIQLSFQWRGDISLCFGEWTLPFKPEASTMTWPKGFPLPGDYSLGDFFSWPGTVKVKSR